MTELQVWKEFFQETDEVNIINLDGEFKFQASHLCKVLGYKSTQVALQTHCEDYEIIKLDIGQHYDVNFVSESGFYSLVLGSQKPKAKAFKKWVCRVVLPKLRASDRPLDVASLDQTLEEMQSNFEGLLAAKQYQLESLTRSLTVQPRLQPEGEFLDLLETPKAVKFPHTLEDLHKASGISSKSYIGSIIKTSFKAEEDYTGFYWGQDKVTVKRMTDEVYTILMLVLRSYRGTDLLAMPSLICIERDRYYETNKKKAVNKRIQHSCPGQLDLF